jgi:hypothetical protein
MKQVTNIQQRKPVLHYLIQLVINSKEIYKSLQVYFEDKVMSRVEILCQLRDLKKRGEDSECDE